MNVAWLRDDFNLTTLLLAGACIQSALLFIIPKNVVTLITALGLLSRIIPAILKGYGFLHNPLTDRVRLGRHTVRIPDDDGSIPAKPSEKGVVLFILGVRSHQLVLQVKLSEFT